MIGKQMLFGVALVSGVLVLPSCTTPAQTKALTERVTQLERRSSNQGLVEMVNQIQALQGEVQQLRGETEATGHAIEQVRNDQQDKFQELDRRMAALEGRGASTSSLESADDEEVMADAGGEQTDETSAAEDTAAHSRAHETESEEPDASPLYTEPPVAEAAQPPSATESRTPDAVNEQVAYENVFETLNQGRYDTAIEQLNEFLATYPDGPNADKAQYWLAEAYYVTRNFSAAEDGFRKVLDNHPSSSKAPDALLKIGFIEYERGQWVAARDLLYDVIKRYPQSNAARQAGKRLSRMKDQKR